MLTVELYLDWDDKIILTPEHETYCVSAWQMLYTICWQFVAVAEIAFRCVDNKRHHCHCYCHKCTAWLYGIFIFTWQSCIISSTVFPSPFSLHAVFFPFDIIFVCFVCEMGWIIGTQPQCFMPYLQAELLSRASCYTLSSVNNAARTSLFLNYDISLCSTVSPPHTCDFQVYSTFLCLYL